MINNKIIKKPDYIICCGMPRSGSTLQYQIVKACLELNDNVEVHGWLEEDEYESFFKSCKKSNGLTTLIKIHNFHNLFKDNRLFSNSKFIYVHRDVRDVFISQMNKMEKSFNEILLSDFFVDIHFHFYKWLNFPNSYRTTYKRLMENMTKEVQNITFFLDLNISEVQVQGIVEDLSIDNQLKKIRNLDSDEIFDKQTLLHPNHINSGEQGQFKNLSFIQRYKLENRMKSLLNEQGYNTSTQSFFGRLKFLFSDMLTK